LGLQIVGIDSGPESAAECDRYDGDVDAVKALADALFLFERDYWSGLLAVTNSVPKAALIAGWNRTTLYRRLNQLGIPYPRLRHNGRWGDL